MAHFAELDANNIVVRVLVIPDDKDAAWCKLTFGGIRWVQTSYNKRIRSHFAGIGFIYDDNLDAFIPPRPDNTAGWELDVRHEWVKGKGWKWDEPLGTWVKL